MEQGTGNNKSSLLGTSRATRIPRPPSRPAQEATLARADDPWRRGVDASPRVDADRREATRRAAQPVDSRANSTRRRSRRTAPLRLPLERDGARGEGVAPREAAPRAVMNEREIAVDSFPRPTWTTGTRTVDGKLPPLPTRDVLLTIVYVTLGPFDRTREKLVTHARARVTCRSRPAINVGCPL